MKLFFSSCLLSIIFRLENNFMLKKYFMHEIITFKNNNFMLEKIFYLYFWEIIDSRQPIRPFMTLL
jgi:hypothetical protein